MALLDEADLNDVADPLLLSAPGTEVVWRDCDRLSEGGSVGPEAFNALVVHARARLALLFHRFLAGEVRGRPLRIVLNGQPVAPFDPFHRDNNATQALAPEEVHLPNGPMISIQGYVLPHFSKLALSDYDRLGGEEGFLRNQGFYVYRAGRLIMNGTWFRLVRHGELSQLVRVAIDIPNSLDAMWKITVDKADAQLPSLLRDRLRTLVAGLRRGSAEAGGGGGSHANRAAVPGGHDRRGHRPSAGRDEPRRVRCTSFPRDP